MQINKYINTIKYLKIHQLFYQIYYRLRLFFRRFFFIKDKVFISKEGHSLKLKSSKFNHLSKIDNKFTFLNQSVDFKTIDWNYNQYGKLWAYNLNYMDFYFNLI